MAAIEKVFLHLSIDNGSETSHRFVTADPNETIGNAIAEYCDGLMVKDIRTSKTSHFGDGSVTPHDIPVKILQSFGTRYVFIRAQKETEKDPSMATNTNTNVFDVLMGAQKRYDRLPKSRPVVTAKDRVFNDLLNLCQKIKVGFTPIQVETVGMRIMKTLTNTLWYLDPHQQKLQSRGVEMPEVFKEFHGYNDWRNQKKKAPVITVEELTVHVNSMVDMLMMPWFLNEKFNTFRLECESLLQGMKKYLDFLTDQQQRTARNHSQAEPIRSISDSWTMRAIEPSMGGMKAEYSALKDAMENTDVYQPLFLYDLQPLDRFKRRNWLNNISLPFPVKVYAHHHGNYFGNFTFAWRIPVNADDRGDGDLDAIAKIRTDLDTYSTRAMRKAFMQRYSRVNTLKPAVLRDIYRFLTQDASTAESSHQADVDQRVAEFLVESDEPALFYDLRANNGRPKNVALDPFWDELGRYLEEAAVVHERRHGSHMYMPLAISLQVLINNIAKRLPPSTPVPSVSWLRLNFWPSNSYTRTAMCYTGRFNVRYAVQQRLIRARHPDSPFVFHQLSMLKQLAVKFKTEAEMICLDDKAIVPVGEPGHPVSSGVRAHNPAMVLTGVRLSSLDHDFHIHGVVPSVLFHVDIPDDSADSFYRGTLHVTVKDKVFQPSSAARHSCETVKILRLASTDSVSLNHPILLTFTDGGPDHRSTFWTVQIAYVILFICLDLDMLVTARTAPSQSYANPAERFMSILNMGLQHVAFERAEMDAALELKVKSMTTMKKLRTAAAKQPNLKTALLDSMEPVIAQMKNRFSQLQVHEESIQVHDAATEGDIDTITECLDIFLEEGGSPGVFNQLNERKHLKKFPKLVEFMERHTRGRHYNFQVKKCKQIDCWYCVLNPPRMDADKFAELSWLPDPVLDQTKTQYLSFTEAYGTDTTDKDRPSLVGRSSPTERDKQHKSTLVGGKVRGFVICGECGKRRVVYSQQRLTRTECDAIDRVQEELMYSCGGTLFPEKNRYRDKLLVREGLSCSSSIETTYYSGLTHKFVEICFFCGDTDVANNEMIHEFRKEYSIVRPICAHCLGEGKTPAVRNALKVGKKRRQ